MFILVGVGVWRSSLLQQFSARCVYRSQVILEHPEVMYAVHSYILKLFFQCQHVGPIAQALISRKQYEMLINDRY